MPEIMTEYPRVLDVKLAAQFLHVSIKTILTYSDHGILPHRRLGGRILFSRDELTRWVDEGQPDANKFEQLLRSPKGRGSPRTTMASP